MAQASNSHEIARLQGYAQALAYLLGSFELEVLQEAGERFEVDGGAGSVDYMPVVD